MFDRRQQIRNILVGFGLIGYAKAVSRIRRRIKLACQVAAYPIKRCVYAAIASIFPDHYWAFERLLSLSFSYRYRDPLKGAVGFINSFRELSRIKPAAIFAWRRQAYAAYWLVHDDSGMYRMMQAHIDAQESFVRDHKLSALGFRIADNLLFANYNVHAYLDTHIKAMQLGWQPKHRIFALVGPENVVCNPVMLEYWRAYIDVIDDATAIKLLSPLRDLLTDDLSYVANLNGRAVFIEHAKHQVQKQWEAEKRAPLHRLSQDDLEFGWEKLQELGIPRGSWFVSLHVRDPGCKLGSYQMKDDFDSYRNADIDSYALSIQSIVDQGGYVLRVGDPNMKPMVARNGVIDYAHSHIRSNRMDIFLFTQCKCFVGTASGPIMTSVLFGVPTVMTNFAPMSARPHAGNCIFIPKLLWLKRENRYASFKEVLSSDLGRIFSTPGYEERGIEIIDNSPEELNDVVVEMLDRLNGHYEGVDDDEELQTRLGALYQEFSGYGDLGRIGGKFIKKYSAMGLI